MKNFKLKFISPLILTLILQGCMPDSLTKFKKDAPIKAAPVSTTFNPVDSSGQPVTLAYPTVSTVSITEANSSVALSTKDLRVGNTEILIANFSDKTKYGSLADPQRAQYIFVGCSLDTSGPVISKTLPPGIIVDSKSCAIGGTPTVPYFDTILNSNISYTLNIFYKGPNYTGPGTESKLTATIALGSYYFTDLGVKDTAAIDYPAIAPVGFSYTEKIAGVTTALSTKSMVVGTPVEFDPKTVGAVGAPDGVGGTLSSATRSKYIFLGCSLNQLGTLSSRTLPPGLTLNTATCLITGTPSSAFSDTTFGNMGGYVTYNVDLFYKGPTYTGSGTEVKITTQFQLASVVTNPNTWTNPTTFGFAPSGSTTTVAAATFEVGKATSYVPILNNSLSTAVNLGFSYVSCAVAPALPTGLSLNSSTCKIEGTPTANSPATSYTITMTYKDLSTSPAIPQPTIATALTLSAYYKPSGLTYTQNDKLLFKLNSATGLVSNIETNNYDNSGLLTSSDGITGVVKYIDTTNSTVGVVRVIPLTLTSSAGFVTNDFIYGAAGAIGKIENVVGNIVYVERVTPNINFSAAENVRHNTQASYPSTYAVSLGSTTIASIDSTYVFNMPITALDNNSQYYSSKYTQSSITRVYEKGVTIANPLTPIASASISAANGVTYSIAPALPPGLALDTTTGIISGSFTSILPSTKFTITATNPLGSTTFDLYLSAIDGPKDLSYTNKQLITVVDNSAFNEGEYLFQPITPPLTSSVSGQVLRKFGTTQMSISTVSGQFLSGASIDSGNAYYSEKTTISTTVSPIFYNVALKVSSTATFTASTSSTNYYAASSNLGAVGRVVAIDAGTNTLFLQYLNSAATPVLFRQGDTISAGSTYAASAVTIDRVESDNLKMTLSNVAGILAGDELTADNGASVRVSGYIDQIVGSVVSVSDISRRAAAADTASFITGLDYINNENYTGITGNTISAVSHDNLVIIERGVKTEIEPNLSIGSSIVYTVTPALPTGLAINSQTGVVSGTASFSSVRTTYTISAKNLVNESKFVFELEVRDFFGIADSSGASSFILHKYGDSRGSRKCRINSNDIKTFTAGGSINSQALDVRCFLDTEEADLHFSKLKLNTIVGAGSCDYLQVYPYSFWQYSPLQTTTGLSAAYTAKTTIKSGFCSSGALPTTDLCDGNYASANTYCDEGFLYYDEQVMKDNGAGACVLDYTISNKKVQCGGKKTNCLKGPVRDILTDAQIQGGARSVIYTSTIGTTINSTFSAPNDTLDLTNLRLANGSINNNCTTNNTDANAFTTYQSGLASTDNPFAGGPNPYYVVNCLDAAKDIKARIRVVVRDWNKAFKVKDAIDYDIPGGGTGTTLMNNATVVFGKSNNDYYDWDDAYNGTAANAQTNATAKTCSALGVGGEWGACSDGVTTTQAACLAVPAVWTSYNYKYPQGNL